MSAARAPGHRLTLYTTTARDAGAHVTTGHCTCGWHTEVTFQREARAEYRSHLAKAQAKASTTTTTKETP